MVVVGITDYGKAIKGRLVELNETQDWLVARVSEKTGLYFDTSYLHKIMVGKLKGEKIISAINEILDISVATEL